MFRIEVTHEEAEGTQMDCRGYILIAKKSEECYAVQIERMFVGEAIECLVETINDLLPESNEKGEQQCLAS
jgi:hypothetical protein